MAEILPIQRKTLSNQSINQSINQSFNQSINQTEKSQWLNEPHTFQRHDHNWSQRVEHALRESAGFWC